MPTLLTYALGYIPPNPVLRRLISFTHIYFPPSSMCAAERFDQLPMRPRSCLHLRLVPCFIPFVHKLSCRRRLECGEHLFIFGSQLDQLMGMFLSDAFLWVACFCGATVRRFCLQGKAALFWPPCLLPCPIWTPPRGCEFKVQVPQTLRATCILADP